MIKIFKNIKSFLINIFTQDENVGLVTLAGLKNETKNLIQEKTSDMVIYNFFK